MIDPDMIRRENKLHYLSRFAPNEAVHRIIPSGNISGALLAARCIKGTVTILHGSLGCALHYRYLVRLNNIILDDIICTELTEEDYIMGGAAKLRKTIIETYKKYAPKLILIVPSDPQLVTNDDIEVTVEELADEIDCKLICAKVKTISQPYSRWRVRGDLDLSDEELEAKENKVKTDFELENEDFGCGFADVYRQFIEAYMLPLPKDEKLLVVGGMPTASKGVCSNMDIALEQLGEFGLKILNLNTTVELEEFAKASSAAYSVGFPRGSAYTLKRKFGVKVLADEISELWEHLNDGIDGIENFYLGLIDVFQLGDKAKAKIASLKRHAQLKLSKAGAMMYGESCAFCDDYPGVIPYITKMLQTFLGVHVKYILLTTEDRTYYSPELSEEDIKTMIRRAMNEAVKELGYQPTLIINPDYEQCKMVSNEVDYFIGGDHFPPLHDIGRGVTDVPKRRPDSFEGFANFIISYTRTVRENDDKPNSGQLLKDKLLLLEDKNTKASCRMRFRTK
ncbi:hypothetical protein LQZ18_08630 [Lachnospiraceae bacterium ZAX-1]